MKMGFKELCRLCARDDEFSKDIMDENNKNILKLIKDFIQINVVEDDNLPTRICLSCEEKMVSFQLFILECYKTQESLKKMNSDICHSLDIKTEDGNDDNDDDVVFEDKSFDDKSFEDKSFDDKSFEETHQTEIKSEVKAELTMEDIVSAITNDSSVGYAVDDFDDDEDDISIAALKGKKKKHIKRKPLNREESIKFGKVLNQSKLKVEDFVKLMCNICEEDMKTWSSLRSHYIRCHKNKPVVFCICGFAIRSKSVLYKHVSDHKIENKKLKQTKSPDGKQEQTEKYSELNVNDFVNFVCSNCGRQYSSWYKLKSHCERVHKMMPVVRCICGITLKSKSVMYKHIQDHKNPNVLCCDKCPRITKTESAMAKHKMRHVPKCERKFCCSMCDKIFNTREGLKSHEKSHIPIEKRKIYQCDVCDLKFTTRSSATSHKLVVHQKVKSYVCDLCGYACGTNGELRQHRAIHSDDKPFVCNKCSKPFKTYSNLKTHMDIHEDTSYACFVCNRILNSRRTLRKHLLVHEDKCRHVCSYCNKAFKRRQTLKVHMYTHTGDKPLTCKWCEERFAYASTLRSHRLRCHPDKMTSTQSHSTYTQAPYAAHVTMHQEYLKNDTSAVGVAKNEVDVIM